MVCVPSPAPRSRGDAFNFSTAPDAFSRSFDNTAALMMAPWRAYWAFAFEALEPSNWR